MTGLTAESTPLRDASEVADYARRCFRPAAGDQAPGDQMGVELEFLVFDRKNPAAYVPLETARRVVPEPPGGSRVTFEPGGQLELSGPAGPLPATIGRLTADVAAVRAALRTAGLALGGVGLDPVRPARRQLRLPRYDAMAEYLGRPYGALMMCSTASIQVNLDLGEHPVTRWERAHALGPMLMAAFANSPLSGGRPCGWMSGRQAVWNHLDRTRTAPVQATGDPAADWAAYLLAARLMLVRDDDGHCHPVRDGSTFGDWLRGGRNGGQHAGHNGAHDGGRRRPTAEDLAYHATTVFPPVRPRGWLEIRYLDAQRPADWPVCVAVTHALITDDRAGDAAMAAMAPYQRLGDIAARCGLADPRLRLAAEAGFRAALEALPRLGADPGLVGAVAAFADRYVSTGRSPAADLIDPPAGRRLPPWLSDEADEADEAD